MTDTASKDMGNRPGTAVQRKGRERVEQILDAATEFLIEEGHGQFTMSQLAKRLNIRISNLQYYFPSREQLIQKLLQRFLDVSLDEMSAFSTANTPPRKRLLASVDYILKDQEQESSCKIFWELWALSVRDEKIGEAMASFYENYCNIVYDMLFALNPQVPSRKLRRISVLVVSMIEGLSLMRGFGKQRHSHLQGIEKELRETILKLIDA